MRRHAARITACILQAGEPNIKAGAFVGYLNTANIISNRSAAMHGDMAG